MNQPQPHAERAAHRVQGARHGLRLVRHDQEHVANLGACQCLDPGDLPRRKELRDRRPQLLVRDDANCRQPPGAAAARDLRQLVDLTASHVRFAGHANRLNLASACQGAGEDLKPGSLQRLSDVHELQAKTQIGPVDAVAGHAVRVVQAGEGLRGDRPLAEAFADPRVQLFDQGHHVFLLDEAHLEVQLRVLGDAVGARVLIPVAAGDLEVFLDPPVHQQLLHDLGRLRQGEEVARPHA